MMEIYDQYQNLLHTIDQSDLRDRALAIQETIKNDSSLLELINQYHKCPSKELEDEIYANKNYQALKRIETEVNILIMQINFKFQQLKRK